MVAFSTQKGGPFPLRVELAGCSQNAKNINILFFCNVLNHYWFILSVFLVWVFFCGACFHSFCNCV